MERNGSITVDDHLEGSSATATLRAEAAQALRRSPKVLSPSWLYDDRGSELFDEITRLDVYYQTEAERSILQAHADDIVTATGADSIVELGSGTSDKTRTLLDAFAARGMLRRFVPVDVSRATLVHAANTLAGRYPGLDVHAVVGDFTRHLQHLPEEGRRVVVFLGGTIGNLFVEERRAFLGALADRLRPGESLLLGIDLLKPVQRIVDAYNDGQGVTAAFVANVLHVLNHELDADFDVGAFDYVPLWDAREERMDLRLRPAEPQHVALRAIDIEVDVAAGEELHVEISAKFRPERIVEELGELGFDTRELWTDDHDDFAVLLARRR
jgi:L-histidine N-alpha-methyltransferase